MSGAKCEAEGCDGKPHLRGVCRRHYEQMLARGDVIRRYRRRGASRVRNERGEKQCANCKMWFRESEFSPTNHTADGLTGACRPCYRFSSRASRYGITTSALTELMDAQGRRCAICCDELTNRFTVDHDHSCCPGLRACGACVRGILCSNCNTGLGMFKDSPDRLIAAMKYLE